MAVPAAAALVGIAATATLLEQAGLVGLDNLTVPLAVAGLWSLACRP
jgi:phytol kinase